MGEAHDDTHVDIGEESALPGWEITRDGIVLGLEESPKAASMGFERAPRERWCVTQGARVGDARIFCTNRLANSRRVASS